MDVREKLVELLGEIQETGVNEIPAGFGCTREYIANEKVASHLTANGVTVQEWISVTDRLPEDDEVVIICTDKNFVYAGELIGDTWFLDNDSWTETVTHWMPLPPPPKG